MVLVGHFAGIPAIASLGVSLFFAISGYLISRLLMAEGSSLDIGAFYGRRARRLLPALLVLIAVLLIVDGGSPEGMADAASAVGFWSNYRSADLSIVGETHWLPINALWSLAVEVHFYLALPLVVAWCRGSPKKLLAIAMVVCGAVLAYRTSMVLARPELIATNYFYTRTEFRIDALAWGVVAGCAAEMGGRRAPLWVLAVSAFAILLPLDLSQAALRPTVISAALAAGLFGFLHDDRLAWAGRVVAPMVPLGLISYSLYLWHLPAQSLTASVGASTWWAVPLSLLLAVGSYWLLERRPPRPQQAIAS